MYTHRYQRIGFLAIASALCSLPLAAQTAPADGETVQMEKFEVKAMKEFSDQAVVGKTPVTVIEVSKEKIADELASRDIPFALEQSSSFFVTNQGGGAGDSRITLRGFNQRNISILINGVPTNDNENGWLYWSNWDGLGGATANIQLQKGLSYSTLPTPSIGGTLNVTTDPAAAEMGASVQAEVGSNGFQKQTFTANTGLIKGRVAVTASVVRKQGQGTSNGLWTEGQGYYLGASFKLNEKNRIEVYGIAAPQMHGQNSYQQSIATLDANYARKLGFTDAQLKLFPEQGRRYNQRWGVVDPSYTGMQYYYGGLHGRHTPGALNEVVNFYNKPQFNLNWFSSLTDSLTLSTVVYYSGGEGAGGGVTGTTVKFGGGANPAPVDWNRTIAANAASTTGSKGILYNNTNYQDTYGAVSKLSYALNNWKFSTGLDARMASIDHWTEVRDLLGGSYYTPSTLNWASANAVKTKLDLGDKYSYYYTNDIKWLGSFLQTQYEKGPITAFGVYGYSVADYKFTNHFVVNSDGSERTLKSKTFDGHQIKGGLQYAFNKRVAVFGNLGYVTKLPIASAAVNTYGAGSLYDRVPNENFRSAEAGVRTNFLDRKLTLSSSFYYTEWSNRTATSSTDNYKFADGTTGTLLTYQTGLKSTYSGVETEAAYQPNRWVRFDASCSVNNWYFTGDGQKVGYEASNGAQVSSSVISLKGVKVGEAPQTQFNGSTTVFPVKGLSLTANVRNAQRYYSSFNAEARTADYGQSWKVPNFTVVDFHANYRLNLTKRMDVKLFLHVINVFDKVYIQDATDNYFSATATGNAAAHSAQRAEVYMGTPFSYNTGVKFSF